MSSPQDDRALTDTLDAVAIIGMAGRFPGAGSIEGFWRNLRDGVESISPVSLKEMLEAGVDPAAARDPHRVAAASTLAGIEYFDDRFFGISPRQAELTDPQHRIFLECAWEAMENAGYDPGAHGRGTGVFAGSSISTYLLFHLYPWIASVNRSSDLQALIGNDKDYLATLVAYTLGLTGPAINVQTACSTSLVAVHLACQSLLNRECDLALAGGVTVRLPARAGYLHEIGGILSPDGHCRPFDAQAQGTVFGSGLGIVVLKRLSDALTDGDVIDAVIRGSAVNNDGSLKAGYTAPSEDGQAMVVAEALALASVEPSTIGYVEMHGTGTPIGDPIEVAALARAFRSRGHPLTTRTCAVGAVKSNFGHLESAAGVAGLIKTVLALTHRQIPPTLHFARPNPAIDFERTPFYVNDRLLPWETRGAPRRAGVSSFGIGGTNAHVVLEEAPEPAEAVGGQLDDEGIDRPYLLPLSAREPAAVDALSRRYRDFLSDAGEGARVALPDVCWSAGARRPHHEHRLAVAGRTREELVAQLAVAGEQSSDQGTDQIAPARRHPRVVFVFPGQGSQWIGMGRQLLEREPAFRAALQRCDQVAQRYTGWSLLAELSAHDDADRSPLQRTDRIQLALFAIQIGLAAWWRSMGVEPDAVVGHSMGEVAAAHMAGALSLPDAVRVLCERNRLIEQTLGQGRMMVIGQPASEVAELLAGHETGASIAIVNSPKSVVVSGDPTVLESVAATLRDREAFHRWIDVDFASHSPQMDPLVRPLREALRGVRANQATIPIISTVTGEPIDPARLDAEYWARNLREPVLFADATRWLREHDHELFLEISPHPILLPAIEDSLYHLGQSGTVVACTHRDGDEQLSLLQAMGTLYTAGYGITWDRLYPRHRFVRLPTYPWQRRRHWVEPAQRQAPDTNGQPAHHPLLGRRLRSALAEVAQFESKLSPVTVPYLDDHRVFGRAVFPAAAYLEMFWQAAAEQARPHAVTDIVLHDLLGFADQTPHIVQTILTQAEDGARLELFSWEPETATWRTHATAKVCAHRTGDDLSILDLAEAGQRCLREISPETYYERLRQEGLEYGPLFRGIESLRAGDGEVLGRVRLPADIAGEAGAYATHPALLDACLQLIGAAFPVPDPARTADDTTGSVYLPVAAGSLRIAAPAGDLVTVHALVGDGSESGSKTCDIHIYNAEGRPVAEILGLRVKQISRSALRRALRDDLNDWCYELQWRKQPPAVETPSPAEGVAVTPPRRWLILADNAGTGQALAELLEQRGQPVAVAALAGIDAMEPDAFTELLATGDDSGYRELVYLCGLDSATTHKTTAQTLAVDEPLTCSGVLHLVQSLIRQPWAARSRLWLVTRDAQAPQPSDAPPAVAQAAMWGLGRTIAVEHPELSCLLVDLDAENSLAQDDALTLLAEHDAAERDAAERDAAERDAAERDAAERQGIHGPENQVAWRHGERFVARLVRCAPQASAPERAVPAADRSVRLTIPTPGDLDGLTYAAAQRRPPGAGEVEIRVRATGLNFRDVLNALGAYPGEPGPPGLECAGEIVAVGGGVDEFEVGDAVVALAPGCFTTHVTAPAVLVAKKPERLTFAEAASIPIAFLTAHFGLCRLAGMARGDRILIHSAAGGLGLAATQLAQRAGAEVFATAGSEAKHAHLRAAGVPHIMPSRTLDFAGEVMAATAGRGVNIVLNALTGEFIPLNLSVLATGGRFVEVGKTGAWDAARVGQVRPDVSYLLVDLDRQARDDPALVGGMLRDLMREFAEGTLHPLPHRVFAWHEASSAFRFMAQAKHIGKIVVTQQAGLSGTAADRFRPDASYLITGGLGGLGRQVAGWMVEQGARHLALVGRSDPSAVAQATVRDLTGAGAQVLVIAADVARPDEVARVLRTIGESMPPLRGIVHAAGVLDDGILLNQDWQRFARVLAPKVRGAWNLHTQTSDTELDFFVLFSSIAAILGSPGQGSYAAANAFLDALAHARRKLGLPALSIEWGGWSRTGLAARDDVADRMAAMGMSAITPEAGLVALEHAMRRQEPQLAVMPVDWAALLATFPPGRSPALLAELARAAQPGGDRAATGRSDLLHRLDAAGPENRRKVLTTHLVEQARQALGLDAQTPLDLRRPLTELGLTSLVAIEMRGKLSAAIGRALPATILFDHPTIEALANHLATEVLKLPNNQKPDEGVPVPEPATDIERMTDDEVEAVLTEELAAVQTLLGGVRS